MLDFNFFNPTKIVFGQHRLEELHDHIPQGAKVMITYGTRSAVKSGLINRVKACIPTCDVIEFGGIEANPSYDTLSEAANIAREENIDFLLAVGGGSVMDGTKFIALAAEDETGGYYNILYHGFEPVPQERAIPMGCIATLPATGSEMNCAGVVMHNNQKMVFLSPLVFPKFSFLDPSVTLSAPKEQIANGIIDAFVHVTEQYLTIPANAKVQDRLAEGILQTLIEDGPVTFHDPSDIDARKNFMWSATTALNGMIGAGVPQDWSTHLIAHELTALFGIDHGRTLALILPHLLRERRIQKHAKLVQYAERIWQIHEGTEAEKVDAAINKTEQFFQALNVPTHLKAYGIGKADIPRIIENMALKGLKNLSESGDLTLDIVEKILHTALQEKTVPEHTPA